MALEDKFIRFFGRVSPHTKEEISFDEISYYYFCGLHETGAEIRVIPTRIADVGAAESRWAHYAEELIRPVPNHYINVVCGSFEDICKFYTDGHSNLAIASTLDGSPNNIELTALHKYEAVICPREEDADILIELGVDAMRVIPEIDTLTRLLSTW